MTTTSSDDLLICVTCGTQFDLIDRSVLTSCHICDDLRQYVPPTGQSFTTLRSIKAATKPAHVNSHDSLPTDDRFISLTTTPKVGIGQRAILIRTPKGNVMWDCIPYLSTETISYINSLGGLKAIVISHPHFYTTHLIWAETFDCPVYLSREDEEHLSRVDHQGRRIFIDGEEADIQDTGVKAIKLGGHFPGSLVAIYDGRIMTADTLLVTPSGIGNWGERARPQGMTSFAFMWSIPNMIPLGPKEMSRMWSILKKHDFRSAHGAFLGHDILTDDVKKLVLESMKIQTTREEYIDHPLLGEQI